MRSTEAWCEKKLTAFRVKNVILIYLKLILKTTLLFWFSEQVILNTNSVLNDNK